MFRPFIIFEGTAANVRIKRKFEYFLFLWYNIYSKVEKGRELMAKVTPSDVERFAELYAKLGSYAAVARETGFSASTVSNHLKAIPKNSTFKVEFNGELMPPPMDYWMRESWNDILKLSDEEKAEIEELWKEVIR
jgi:hypothetical protein